MDLPEGFLCHFSHSHTPSPEKKGTARISRALNLAIPKDFGYTGLACGLVGPADGTDCAVLYDAHQGALRLKRVASWNVSDVRSSIRQA